MQVPDTKVAEIIDGELIVSPRPASPHAHAATVIGIDVGGPFHRRPGDPAGPGGWWLLLEPELHLGEDVLVPDWAGWRRERLPVFPDTPAFTQAPDWVCEVISPSTGRIDRGRKMRIYARDGVAHLWFVEPQLETLEIYRLEAGRWVVLAVHAGDDAIGAGYDVLLREPRAVERALGGLSQPETRLTGRRSTMSSRPSAAAMRPSVARHGVTPPASSRATAGCVLPIREASSAWVIPRRSRARRTRSASSKAALARR